MIITADEYRSMGFTADNEDELNSCLLRAEYIIGAITQGKARQALEAGGTAAQYVKQAAAFQTFMLLGEVTSEKSKKAEKVTIGDFSYTTDNSEQTDTGAYDLGLETVRLLRAAGCLYSGLEAKE